MTICYGDHHDHPGLAGLEQLDTEFELIGSRRYHRFRAPLHVDWDFCALAESPQSRQQLRASLEALGFSRVLIGGYAVDSAVEHYRLEALRDEYRVTQSRVDVLLFCSASELELRRRWWPRVGDHLRSRLDPAAWSDLWALLRRAERDARTEVTS